MSEQPNGLHTRERFYIDGEWRSPHGTGAIEIEDPATENSIGTVPHGNEDDVDAAAKAAREAFGEWSNTPLEERLDYLEEFYQAYQDREDELTETMRAETGIPARFARPFLTEDSGEIIGSAIENARTFEYEYELDNGSRIVHDSYGVVAAISPWNNPMFLALNKIAMALAAGCTVVHKPASKTPGAGFTLADIAEEVGLPDGVLNVVSGSGSDVGDAIVSHPEVDLVDFTGSLATGPQIAKSAADGVKKVILELGGKSPVLALEDADMEAAVETVVASSFLLSGQTCGAFTRLIVPEAQLDEVNELARVAAEEYTLGPTDDMETMVGPVASASQQAEVQEYIQSGIDAGFDLLVGGAEVPEGFEQGHYVQPTIFSDVDNDSKIAQEEIFGPVLCIVPYEDEGHGINLANDVEYGLRAAVFGEDEDRAVEVAKQIRAGQVDINGDKFTLEAPWGGYKKSGYGRCMGRFGLEEFLQIKSLQVKDDLGDSYD